MVKNNKRLKQIALELIHQPNLAERFKRRLADIFFPSNVTIIKDPLAEFDILDDKMDSCLVLSCWKLQAILDKIHEDLPPTPGYHWKYSGQLLHPKREGYKYLYFNMAEGYNEEETSARVTEL